MKGVLDFDVTREKIYLNDETEIKGKEAIVRTDNRDVLGIVTPKYKLVEHREVDKTFTSISLLRKEKEHLCKGGQLAFIDYNLDALGRRSKIEVKKGDVVKIMLRAFNSYNRTTGVGFMWRVLRLVCTNGVTVPKSVIGLSISHMGGTVVNRLEEKLIDSMPKAMGFAGKFKEWCEVKPQRSSIEKFFEDCPSLYKGVKDELQGRSIVESEKEGLWGVFNVLTHYISHQIKPKRGKDLVLAQQNKESKVLDYFYRFNWSN